jgi:hypothetical protein
VGWSGAIARSMTPFGALVATAGRGERLQRRHWQRLGGWVALLATVGLVAAACGSSQGSSSNPSSSGTGTTAGPTTTTSTTAPSTTAPSTTAPPTSTTTAPPPTSSAGLTLSVTGVGPAAVIRVVADGQASQYTDVTLPWSQTLATVPNVVTVSAQNGNSAAGSLTCGITRSGVTLDTETRGGSGTVVQCGATPGLGT